MTTRLFKMEENSKLTAQQRYDIINFAIQAAIEDEGFFNKFIFDRALCLYALVLLEEDKDKRAELQDQIEQDMLGCWTNLIKSGVVDSFIHSEADTYDLLVQEGKEWSTEYKNYFSSIGGFGSILQNITGNVVERAEKQLNDFKSDESLQQVLEMAREWGLESAN